MLHPVMKCKKNWNKINLPKHDIWPPLFDRETFGRQIIDHPSFDRRLIDRRDIRPPPNSLQLSNAKWLFKVTQGR